MTREDRYTKATKLNVIADEYFAMAHNCVNAYLQLSKMDMPSLTKKYLELSRSYTNRGYNLRDNAFDIIENRAKN